jgi:hypothetical protein
MGRPKGSKNSKTSAAKSTTPSIRQHLVKVENKPNTEVLQASLMLETPLLMCRRCQGAFETTEEYTSHHCPVQVYSFAVENVSETAEDETEFTITEIVEKTEEDLEEITETKKKTPRKPYKKRVKKEIGEKPSKEPAFCPTCNKSFTRKYHLDRHLVHTSCNPGNIEKEEFACEVCGKSFSRIDNLRMHLRAHLGQKSRSRDFQCPYCDKSFYGSSLLNIHIRTHTKEKPYLCDWEGCGKGFPSSGALTKHR